MKYLSILLILFISIEIYSQSDNDNASIRTTSTSTQTSSTYRYYWQYTGFDECTYNSNSWFALNVKIYFDDGTVLCETLMGNQMNEPNVVNGIEWGPFTMEHNVGFTIFTEFSLLHPIINFCGELPSGCEESLVNCCYSFDCCDCTEFEDVYEGMWYDNISAEVGTLEPSTAEFVHRFGIEQAFYPPAPNHIGYQLGGCTCCTF